MLPSTKNPKTKFARGWQSLADNALLLTKVTDDGEVTYRISFSTTEDLSPNGNEGPSRVSVSASLNADRILLLSVVTVKTATVHAALLIFPLLYNGHSSVLRN